MCYWFADNENIKGNNVLPDFNVLIDEWFNEWLFSLESTCDLRL